MGTVASSRCRDFSVRNPDMLPGYCRADPRFPGAAEAVQGGRHKACFVGRGRGCARLGAGLPTEKGDRLLLKGALFAGALPAPAGGGVSLAPAFSPAAPQAPGRPGAVPTRRGALVSALPS